MDAKLPSWLMVFNNYAQMFGHIGNRTKSSSTTVTISDWGESTSQTFSTAFVVDQKVSPLENEYAMFCDPDYIKRYFERNPRMMEYCE